MISSEQAADTVGRFRGRRILVVGDLMLDRYISGSVSRISPEAPVPVVCVRNEHSQPGGAANVALNIQSLGGAAVVAGIVGKDEAAGELEALLSGAGIDTAGMLQHDGIATTVKTRILAERQQVVRVDRECADGGMPAELERAMCERIGELASGVDGIVIEDYGKGVVSQKVVDAVLAAAGDGIPVGFDPKENHELTVAGVAVATPNYSEALSAAGLGWGVPAPKPGDSAALASIAEALRAKWKPGLLIVTLGSQGMYMVPEKGTPRMISTKAREVFDVSGAGDTVIAAAVLATVAGADHETATSLANYAAGVVVGKIGTATCSPDELLACVEAREPE